MKKIETLASLFYGEAAYHANNISLVIRVKKHMTSVLHAALAGTQALIIRTIFVTRLFLQLGAWHAAKTRTCLLRFSALKARGSMLADSRLS